MKSKFEIERKIKILNFRLEKINIEVSIYRNLTDEHLKTKYMKNYIYNLNLMKSIYSEIKMLEIDLCFID